MPENPSEAYVPKLPEVRLICGKNMRFPPNVNYMCKAIGSWKMNLDMLQLAVNVTINKNKLDRGCPMFKTEGEVETFDLEKIKYLHYFIQEPDFVMDRCVFENYHEEN